MFLIKKISILLFFFLALLALHQLKNTHAFAQTPIPPVCGTSPSDVVLDIDRSGSMSDQIGTTGTKLANAKSAAKKFVDLLSQDTRNHVGLSSFSTEGTIDAPITSDYAAVKTKITALAASGDTCTDCGVFKGNSNIAANGRAGVKKVIILLTDGRANVVQGSHTKVSSTVAENKAIEEVKSSYSANGTVFFTIGLGNDVNASFLKEIASLTGGKYYASTTTDQLDGIYQQISQIIAKGSISGVVFNDANSNGTLDTGEANLSGWTVQLLKTGSATVSVTSDADGGYSFKNLCDGSYTVKESVKAGWDQTLPTNSVEYSLTLANGNSLTAKNFGNFQAPVATPTTAPTCNKNPITLSVTPDGGAIGAPGTTLNYTVKVTNADQGTGCAPETINLSATMANNPGNSWTWSFDQTQFTINQGQSATTKLHVTSPANAQNGPYTITVIAQGPNGQQSYNVVYNVLAPLPSPTPTPTNTPPTPTPTLTPQPTHVPPTVTPTHIPPSPTVSPSPLITTLNMSIGLDGIGTTPKFPIGGNHNPLNNSRFITVDIYNAATNERFQDAELGTSFFYNPGTSRFEGSFTMDQSFTSGIYNIYARSPQSLYSQLIGSLSVTQGGVKTVPVINLVTGNIDNQDQSNNKIDLLDYGVLISCSIYSQDNEATCDANPEYKNLSDLNDDGVVNEDDLTLWLGEIANQQGAQLPQ